MTFEIRLLQARPPLKTGYDTFEKASLFDNKTIGKRFSLARQNSFGFNPLTKVGRANLSMVFNPSVENIAKSEKLAREACKKIDVQISKVQRHGAGVGFMIGYNLVNHPYRLTPIYPIVEGMRFIGEVFWVGMLADIHVPYKDASHFRGEQDESLAKRDEYIGAKIQKLDAKEARLEKSLKFTFGVKI